MAEIALITGSSEKNSDVIAKRLEDSVDNSNFTPYTDVDSFINSYSEGRIYHRVIILFKAATDNSLRDLINFLSTNSRETEVVFGIVETTSRAIVDKFNELFALPQYVVSKIMTGSGGAIVLNGLASLATDTIGTIKSNNPNYNKLVVKEVKVDTPQVEKVRVPDTTGLSLGDFADMGSETGYLQEEPDEDEMVPESTEEDKDDAPPEGDPVDIDSPSEASVFVGSEADSLESVKSFTDTILSEDIQPSSKYNVVIGISGDKTVSAVLKSAVLMAAYKKRVAIVDLDSEHAILSSIEDDIDTASTSNFGWGIESGRAYRDMGIDFISSGKGSSVSEPEVISVGSNNRYKDYDFVYLVMGKNELSLLEYKKHLNDMGIYLIIGTSSQEILNTIEFLSDYTKVPDEVAIAYQGNGKSLWAGEGFSDKRSKEMPRLAYDRVAWLV